MGKLRARVTVSDAGWPPTGLALSRDCMTASLVWEAPAEKAEKHSVLAAVLHVSLAVQAGAQQAWDGLGRRA
jgi:hypothetical protein